MGSKAGTSREAAEERQCLFIEAYIENGRNGTKAAIAAGFSEKTAAQQASRLLRDVKVQAAIKERSRELAAEFKLRSEDVIRNLARALYFDPRNLFREDGSLKAMHELDEDTAQALAGLEVVEMAGGVGVAVKGSKVKTVKHVAMFTKKVKWLDKNVAREQAMKHLGLFKDDNEQLGKSIGRAIVVPAKQASG